MSLSSWLWSALPNERESSSRVSFGMPLFSWASSLCPLVISHHVGNYFISMHWSDIFFTLKQMPSWWTSSSSHLGAAVSQTSVLFCSLELIYSTFNLIWYIIVFLYHKPWFNSSHFLVLVDWIVLKVFYEMVNFYTRDSSWSYGLRTT